MASNFRQYLPGLTAAIGIVPLSMGLYGALDPGSAMQTAFAWKSPTNVEDRRLVHALMRLYSIRSIGFGLGSFVTWYFGNPRVQGYMLLSGWIVALGDGITCYQYTHKLADGLGHWYFIPVSLGLGAALVGWI